MYKLTEAQLNIRKVFLMFGILSVSKCIEMDRVQCIIVQLFCVQFRDVLMRVQHRVHIPLVSIGQMASW
jgi:hypothetical protein